MVHPYSAIIYICRGEGERRKFLYTEMLKWKYFNGHILCEKYIAHYIVCLYANFCVNKRRNEASKIKTNFNKQIV